MKSQWQLEMYAVQALPEAELEAFERALQNDAALCQRLADLHASSEKFFADYPAEVAIARIQRRVDDARNHRRVGGVRVQSLSWRIAGAAALIVAFLLPARFRSLNETAVDSVRLKGEPALLIYRQRDNHAELLQDGAVAKRGEVLQLAYHGAGARYGAIISIDGRGHLTQHFPESGQAQAAALQDKANLPFAYELDDAPDFERFFFFSSLDPFVLAPLIESVRRGMVPTAEAGVWVQSVVVRKERP